MKQASYRYYICIVDPLSRGPLLHILFSTKPKRNDMHILISVTGSTPGIPVVSLSSPLQGLNSQWTCPSAILFFIAYSILVQNFEVIIKILVPYKHSIYWMLLTILVSSYCWQLPASSLI